MIKRIISGAVLLLLTLVGVTSSSQGNPTSKASSPTVITLTADNTIYLNQPFDDDTTSALAVAAREMDARLPSGYPMYLVLDTPGGVIDSGIDLITVLRGLNRPVHTVVIRAYSMGFHTVQHLGNRYILAKGTLMAHRARGAFGGEFPAGSLDTRFEYYRSRVLALDAQAIRRSHNMAEDAPVSEQLMREYAMLIQNEFWCDGRACVDKGFADAVVTARCDASLNGTREEVLKLFFFGRRIEVVMKYAKCPLVTGMLGYDVSINGINAFRSDEDRKKDSSGYNWDRLSDIKAEEMVAISNEVKKAIKEHTDKSVRPY